MIQNCCLWSWSQCCGAHFDGLEWQNYHLGKPLSHNHKAEAQRNSSRGNDKQDQDNEHFHVCMKILSAQYILSRFSIYKKSSRQKEQFAISVWQFLNDNAEDIVRKNILRFDTVSDPFLIINTVLRFNLHVLLCEHIGVPWNIFLSIALIYSAQTWICCSSIINLAIPSAQHQPI